MATEIGAFEELDRIICLIKSRSRPGPPRTPGEVRELMDMVRALGIYSEGAWRSVRLSLMAGANLDFPAHAHALAALLHEASGALALVDSTLALSIESGQEVDDASYWKTRKKLDEIGVEFLRAWPSLIGPVDGSASGWREFRALPVFAWDGARRRPYLKAPVLAASR
jgi:hypothetical protein